MSAGDIALLNRITWGANASTAARLSRIGTETFIREQFHPARGERLPPPVQAQIDALKISQEPAAQRAIELEQQRRDANAITDPHRKRDARRAYRQALADLRREAASRSLLRDLYSPDQLKEQLTWFWLNYFNVSANKGNIRALIGDYEETAIRRHALGRFRDLLAATLHHPAMLIYLDNNRNAVGQINENYAREIMELHTLGVGSGYTQKDVQELARILTGVGVNLTPDGPKVRPTLRSQLVRDGLFVFNPNRHDYDDKIFLGHRINGRGLAEVDQALDILNRAPATSRFVSRKLAQSISSPTIRHPRWWSAWPRRFGRRTEISRPCSRQCSTRLNSKLRSVRALRIRCTSWSRQSGLPMTTGRSSTHSHCRIG